MFILSFLALSASIISVLSAPPQQVALGEQGVGPLETYLIETNPGETQWVTEDQKWALRRDGINFMDITATKETYPAVTVARTRSVKYPSETVFNASVKSLAKDLSKKNMQDHLQTFTSFHTRYYKSSYGIQSAEWLFEQVNRTIVMSGADKYGAFVQKFAHEWGQFSIIATIPGKSNKTVVIGAHQDSINLFLPAFLAAPGADDDGSGTVTILEALRVLLQSKDVIKGKAENTVEFHWYSAEEGGLLGSQAIFSEYSRVGRDVKAMLQQDMTGYVARTLAAGEPESVGVITDFVDPNLTEFIKKVITTYCDIPYILTKCGYACSDHASASKYGYPSAFVIESDFKYSDQKIHTTEDKIEYLNFDHMLQHAKFTLGLNNPFAKRSEFGKPSLIAYKILTIISWLLVIVTALFYTFNVPADCKHSHHCHTIWGQNSHMRTPFSLNFIVTSVYWIILFILQGGYIWHLYSANEHFVTSAANVGSHFIFNNLLTFGFIMLWVRGHFWPGELLLIVNFFNLTSLYFRHSTTPRFVHIPVVSAPYAWTFVAIFWDGAAMVHARSLPARILANIAIWGILGFGAFFLLAFKDYTIGFELAILSLSLALAQMATHVIAFQWIFAFVIMGCLVVLSVLIGIPGALGERGIRREGDVVDSDRERAPLLDDH